METWSLVVNCFCERNDDADVSFRDCLGCQEAVASTAEEHENHPEPVFGVQAAEMVQNAERVLGFNRLGKVWWQFVIIDDNYGFIWSC